MISVDDIQKAKARIQSHCNIPFRQFMGNQWLTFKILPMTLSLLWITNWFTCSRLERLHVNWVTSSTKRSWYALSLISCILPERGWSFNSKLPFPNILKYRLTVEMPTTFISHTWQINCLVSEVSGQSTIEK